MKLLLLDLLLFIATTFGARAQLILNEGDVWTHSVTTMSSAGSIPRFGGQPNYGLLHMSVSQLSSGATLRYEMFEGSIGQGLIRSGLITSTGNFDPAPPDVWQDLNGSARLTMLTGACTVATISFNAGTGFGNNINLWGASVTLTSPPPRLVVARLTNAVEVSWWTNGTSAYVLETTNALNSGAWPVAAVTPSVISNRNVVTLSPTNQMYFRLRK